MKYLLSLFLFAISSFFLQGQIKEINQWRFGGNAGIDWNTGVPVTVTGSQLSSKESSSTIADTSGNLLFYTEGLTVWNRNNQPMPNANESLGTSLKGHWSTSQGSIIIRKDICTYYLFGLDQGTPLPNEGMSYSVVDMTLEGGLGDVRVGEKNIQLTNFSSEKMTAILHGNGKDVWVITRKYHTDSIYAFLLTSKGVNPVPVKSGSIPSGVDTSGVGEMKVSPDGSKLAVAIGNNGRGGRSAIYDFNNLTGMISNRTIIDPMGLGAVGVEFSRNSNVLYFTAQDSLFQFDITAPNINASRIGIDAGVVSPSSLGYMQLAPDDKIYIGVDRAGSLAVINQPNNLGLAGNFNLNGFNLGAGTSTPCLPQTFYRPFTFSYSSNNTCENDVFTFTTNFTVLSWNFGDPASGAANVSTDQTPTHVFSDSGLFVVSLITNSGGIVDTTTRKIRVLPTQHFIDSVRICFGDSFLIGGIFETTAGDYSDTIIGGSVNGCDSSYTINLQVDPLPPVDFTSDVTSLCEFSGQDVNFSSIVSTGATVTWDFGDGSPEETGLTIEHNFPLPGSYDITLRAEYANSCANDTTKEAYITVNPNPVSGFTINPNPASTEDPFVEFLSFSDSSIVDWIWIFTDQTINGRDTSFTFSESGEYEIIHIVTDINGCLDTAIQLLEVRGDYRVYVPNTFTPNNDGLNDEFLPQISGVSEDGYRLVIFNRWGEKVFESDNKQLPWDGTSNGTALQNGGYVWKLEFKDLEEGRSVQKRGHVNIIR